MSLFSVAALKSLNVADHQTRGRNTPHPGYEPNTNDDIIEVKQLIGISIFACGNNDLSTPHTLRTTTLDSDTVKTWLEPEETSTGSDNLVAKLLLGEQGLVNDCLKPPACYQCCQISRRQLTRALRISSRGVAKMGMVMPWALPLPLNESEGAMCYGVGVSGLWTTWTYDSKLGVNYAFITTSNSKKLFELANGLVDQLKNVSHLPGFIPSIAIEFTVGSSGETLHTWEEDARYQSLHITRHLHQRDAQEAFRVANTSIDMITYKQGAVKAALAMARSKIVTTLGSRPEMSVEARISLQRDHEIFSDIIHHRTYELEMLLGHCEALLKRTKVQITSILGLMAFNQQEISQGIAQATKQDGSSMKTLAVMTMLFLPSTAVAAVLAIPVFEWDATSSTHIANSRIWIFFVVAIPLTIITMISFHYWLMFDGPDAHHQKPAKRKVHGKKPRHAMITFFSGLMNNLTKKP